MVLFADFASILGSGILGFSWFLRSKRSFLILMILLFISAMTSRTGESLRLFGFSEKNECEWEDSA